MAAVLDTRRRSVDVGGLRLATQNRGHGNGWVGNQDELQTRFAELLTQLYQETQLSVTQHRNPPITPPPSELNRLHLISALNTWRFEPFSLTRDEVMSCTILLFEALFRIDGLQASLGITLDQVISTIHHLREIYRSQNAYHNFEHALDVLQAVQAYLQAAGLVPPITILLSPPETMWTSQRSPQPADDFMSALEAVDIFVLYIAAIGHDVGHPGFTNAFMKTTQAPLSVMFDDKSALEQMHFQLLLQIMRCNGLGVLFETRPLLKKLLQETILATDMRIHFDFMTRFRTAMQSPPHPSVQKLLISQAIIKCADISNPSRPHNVSKRWAAALIKEWTNQRHFEAKLELVPSLPASNNPLGEAQSQVEFMRGYVVPLLELMASAVPECQPFLGECRLNFRIWEQTEHDLLREAGLGAPSPPDSSEDDSSSSFLEFSDDYFTAFSLTLPRVPSPKSDTRAWSSDSSTQSEYSTPCSPSECGLSPFPLFAPDPPSQHERRPSVGSIASEAPSTQLGSPSVPPLSGHSHHDSEFSFSSFRVSPQPSAPNSALLEIRAAAQAACHSGLGVKKQKSMAKNLNRSSWSSPIPPSHNPFRHLSGHNDVSGGPGGHSLLVSNAHQSPVSSLQFMVSTSDIPQHRRADSDASSSSSGDVEEVRKVLARARAPPLLVTLKTTGLTKAAPLKN